MTNEKLSKRDKRLYALEERDFTAEEEKYYANLVKDWVIGKKKKD